MLTPHLLLAGRIILAYFFLENGYHHFSQLKDLTGYASSKGVKWPRLSTQITGLLLIFGGLSILLGVLVPYGVAALFIFLLGTLIKMHTFWKETDPTARMMSRIDFMKNLALIGAVLMMLAIPTPWPWSLYL